MSRKERKRAFTCQHRDNGKQDLFNALNRRPPLYKMESKRIKQELMDLNSFMHVFCTPDPDETADTVDVQL